MSVRIESNFSVEEIVKYAEMPEGVRDSISTIFDTIKSLENEIQILNRNNELLSEAVGLRNEFIEQVLLACKDTTKHKELVKQIRDDLESSSIELL